MGYIIVAITVCACACISLYSSKKSTDSLIKHMKESAEKEINELKDRFKN